MVLTFTVPGGDFNQAGRASGEVKKVLARLGVDPGLIKRVAVAMYEAEINMVIHAGGGTAIADISPERVILTLEDSGPGIPDLDLAMQEGYSTAPEWIRELGFGAGMGLPNMKRNSDELAIDSSPGRGTRVTIILKLRGPEASAPDSDPAARLAASADSGSTVAAAGGPVPAPAEDPSPGEAAR